jgi:CRISPR-associated endonuclease/helicase Cas3
MVYMLPSSTTGREDSILNLLGCNKFAVDAYRQNKNGDGPPIHLRQAFMTAAQAFQVIDAPTKSILVPYRVEAQNLIEVVTKASEDDLPLLLRKAQPYCVNLFHHELDRLRAVNALITPRQGLEIYALDRRFYSDELGVSVLPAVKA